ncbi:TM2 domain-containing protein [Sinomicrobium kalidii]|uniref:TM2 domain-containing protein n=1 Tax=Sinomicrobium kalidii TaxID=2900738 RepID=UPI001E38D286|nr:TM2 domain-containing protein [Sinomicrobium kalidii]UGU17335.1 TM2 domain-containing protein [Sinomicrobium kalidii]
MSSTNKGMTDPPERGECGAASRGVLLPENGSKRILIGVLAIFVGFLGIHKFVLGYIKEGIVQLVFTAVTFGFGGLIGLVEGIIYLTRSDEAFYQTYQAGKRSWF